MKIQATDLKNDLKKLAQVVVPTFYIGPEGISAKDPEVWVVALRPMDLGGPFSVDGKKLSQVIRRMSGEITLEREKNTLLIRSGKSKVDLEVFPMKPAEYPKATGEAADLALGPLNKALGIASNSASPKKSAVGGNVVQIKNGRVIGTDGDSLATVPGPEGEFLLNLAAARSVQLMDGDTVSVAQAGENLYFKTHNSVVYASKTTKAYPDVSPLFGPIYPRSFKFKTEDFESAFQTVEPLVDEAGSVRLQISTNYAILSSVSVGSRAEEGFEIEQIEPDPIFEPQEFETGFKAKYLRTFLSSAGPEFTFGFNLPGKPAKFESGDVTYIVISEK